jgi:hypothetical protein
MPTKKTKSKRIKAKIVARAGRIDRRDEMQIWLTRRSSLVVMERQWPGRWPPQVGDEVTIELDDAGEANARSITMR